MDKRKLIEKMIEKLQGEMDVQLQAARAAHEAATHEESRAEDQHDTRGLEASYLAGAQAQRAADLKDQIYIYGLLPTEPLPAGSAIVPGALVELQLVAPQGRRSFYFIAPKGGGSTVTLDGINVQVITPQSPLGDAIVGRKSGDPIEVEGKDVVREYLVVTVS